jgi:enoyl-CoA hydratase/carnithine racemase
LKDSYEYVTVEKRLERDTTVALIALNREQALNDLCDALFEDLIHAATAVNSDDSIGCLVLTGSIKAFAATPNAKFCGTDVKDFYQWTLKNLPTCTSPSWLSLRK